MGKTFNETAFPTEAEHRLSLGSFDYNGNGKATHVAEVRWSLHEGRFSASGSVWNPHRRGDGEMGGQCLEELAAYFPDNALLQRIVAVWKRWHLNDMRAGCEHQRNSDFLKDADRDVFRWHYTLNGDTFKARMRIEAKAKERLAQGETVTLSPEDVALVNLPLGTHIDTYENVEPTAPEHYEVDTFRRERSGNPERKTLRWLSPDEHPDGLLAKPCPECGYKYGSKWLREEIPADVVAEIESWSQASTG